LLTRFLEWFDVYACLHSLTPRQLNIVHLATQPASAVVLQNFFGALKLVCCRFSLFYLNACQRDPKRCIGLSLALTGDLDKLAPSGVTPPFATLISNSTGSHVVDKLLECTTPSIFHRFLAALSDFVLILFSIYISFFRGKLSEFALNARANFSVSALLSRVSSRYRRACRCTSHDALLVSCWI
jgi:hypothetical protein